MSYGFLPEAEIEYLQAIGFYEDQRPGLGARLIKEFERTIQIAVERPLTWKMFRSVAFAALIWFGLPSSLAAPTASGIALHCS